MGPNFGEEVLGQLIFIGEVLSQYQILVFPQKFLKSISSRHSGILGNTTHKLSLSHQLLANIQTSNYFTIGVDLRICGPSTVISQPVPHVLIGDDVIVGEGDVLVLQQLKEGFCEAAFGVFCGALDEDDYLRLFENALDLGMPYSLILLELLPKCHYLQRQGIKNTSNILGGHFLQDFFIGLSEENSWCLGDVVLFEGVGAGLLGDEVVFDIFVIAEDGDGGL